MKFIEEIKKITRENQKELSDSVKNKIKEEAKKGLTICKFDKEDIKPYEVDILKNNDFEVKEELYGVKMICIVEWEVN